MKDNELVSPISETLDQDLSNVSRTYLECRLGLLDAYVKTFGLEVGSYYVGLAPAEDIMGGTLLRQRLDEYHKLCIKEHLGFTFDQYLAQPRYRIAEYNIMCTTWSSDPNDIAKKAEAEAKKLLGG